MMRRKKHFQRKDDRDLIRDVSAHVSEHFLDYVVIGRVKDGLVWRFSDRTFAMGASSRLRERLDQDDRIATDELHDHD